jgi:DNA-binding HxlR family transcriptional regulator
MVVRELLLGPKRFTDLRTSLPNIGPDVLTQRLKDLEATGLAHKHKLPPPAASTVYELTPAGRALEPTLQALGRWGAVHAPPPEPGQCMSLDSHLLSLTTLFRPELAEGFTARILLRLDGQEFRMQVADGQMTVERGGLTDPDATITGPAADLIDVVHDRARLEDSDLAIDGDRQVAERFLELSPLPVGA